ncbi:enoyl-CoA hydratase/isomerase family protein [Methylosinus sp. H3A]|uniref:enoyl-CoA hydratase/isomerase family protein n=1 Tax=Methylosinus sp. H3A TaxID=2785786 RepID=UPI0018C27CFF|nr:enoyl-CoA hydratase/isomerase family protein [Methylosinus sp. H3A]MBG0809780.1 enoyl-CoA hydratase/isomerase family protein [Methylosinus sp. H3A]
MSDILVSRARNVGSISLNRPKALNSLTLEMIRDFARALDSFGADSQIVAVVVTGEGARGFCAGGDIRALYELRAGDHTLYETFWREEYELNARIASFPKPYIAVMDGIVMGGGVGLSAHGGVRIVTERTRLAMPETGIGFIPDVGGSFLLTRNGGVGRYMALSGETVGPHDAIFAGLADILVDSASLSELLTLLRDIVDAEEVTPLLARYVKSSGLGALSRNESLLRRVMARSSVERIVAALEADGSEFARDAVATIVKRSPTSLKVTLQLLRRAADTESLEACLLQDFRTACNLLSTHDLYEGIRAAVIDKDRAPHWSPATLAEVDDALVAALLDGGAAPKLDFRAWT